MRDPFINIGNKTYVNSEKLVFIAAADADKVRRYLKKYNIEKKSERVFDATSDKETRSMLVLSDGIIGLSSVNADILVKRASAVTSE